MCKYTSNRWSSFNDSWIPVMFGTWAVEPLKETWRLNLTKSTLFSWFSFTALVKWTLWLWSRSRKPAPASSPSGSFPSETHSSHKTTSQWFICERRCTVVLLLLADYNYRAVLRRTNSGEINALLCSLGSFFNAPLCASPACLCDGTRHVGTGCKTLSVKRGVSRKEGQVFVFYWKVSMAEKDS